MLPLIDGYEKEVVIHFIIFIYLFFYLFFSTNFFLYEFNNSCNSFALCKFGKFSRGKVWYSHASTFRLLNSKTFAILLHSRQI